MEPIHLSPTFTFVGMMMQADAHRLLHAMRFRDMTHPNSSPGYQYWLGPHGLQGTVEPRLGSAIYELRVGPRD